MLLILVKWAVVFAVIAFVYREILSREKILNWWFKFGLRFEKRFFYRPIWGCEKCLHKRPFLAFYFLFYTEIRENRFQCLCGLVFGVIDNFYHFFNFKNNQKTKL